MSGVVPLASGRQRGAVAIALAILLSLSPLSALSGVAEATARTPTSLVLQSQTTDVVGEGAFDLGLHVTSAQPPQDLAIQVSLYSRLSNRTYFDYSLTGDELPSEACLSETAPLPLSGLSGPTTNGSVNLALSVSPAGQSPHCDAAGSGLLLDCGSGPCLAGVYPVEVALVDARTDRALEQFTTHLIELSGSSAAHRLEVGFVLALGGSAALTPGGQSALGEGAVRALSEDVDVLAAHHGVRVTLAAYGQLFAALAEGGRRGARLLRNLDALVKARWANHTLEPIGTPFAPIDASAIAAAHLAPTIENLLKLGNAQLDANLGRTPALDPFVVPNELDGAGNELLARDCVEETLLPPGSISTTASGLTQTAPVLVTPSAHCSSQPGSVGYTEAFSADTASSLLQANDQDAVLRAHQFIAELAQVYFEQPNAAPRAVVVEAPGPVNATLLSTVLTGLAGNPILQTQTLGALFSTIPVGAAGDTRDLPLPTATPTSGSLPVRAIGDAEQAMRELGSLAPSDHALVATLSRSVELAESAAVGGSRREEYLGAPARELARLAGTLSFLGSRSVTLTSQSGDVPITLHQTGHVGPMAVTVRLVSSELVFPKGSSFPVEAFQPDAQLKGVYVETRSSGNLHLYVEVLTPVGSYLLVRGNFTVHARAISGVAVGLSLAALAVLGGWWLRSLRTRRRRRRATAVS